MLIRNNFVVKQDSPFLACNPDGAARSAFKQVVGVSVGVHGDFDVRVIVADGAIHGASSPSCNLSDEH